jgi:hypothetical protein
MARLSRAERPIIEQEGTTCCYARSDKQWIADPQGVPWEIFRTHGEATVYGQGGSIAELRDATRAICCEPPKLAATASTKTAASGCCAA